MAIRGENLPQSCSNYYELLELSPFEADPARIDAQLRSLLREARKYQVGPYAGQAAKCVELLAAAKGCLLDPAQKLRYDEELRRQFDLPPVSVTAALPLAVSRPFARDASPVVKFLIAAAALAVAGIVVHLLR